MQQIAPHPSSEWAAAHTDGVSPLCRPHEHTPRGPLYIPRPVEWTRIGTRRKASFAVNSRSYCLQDNAANRPSPRSRQGREFCRGSLGFETCLHTKKTCRFTGRFFNDGILAAHVAAMGYRADQLASQFQIRLLNTWSKRP